MMRLQDVLMNNEIKALKSELALVKLQFSERVRGVEERLDKLTKQEEYHEVLHEKHTLADSSQYSEIKVDVSPIPEQVAPRIPTTDEEYLSNIKQHESEQPSTPSFITLLIQTILSLLFDWFSPVTKIYQSYKERGMLGIFTLTIVGISLTLAGFGYLMQLLIDQMGAGTKSLLMCLAAISVIGVGIGLKIKTRFGEFATAIVTLGILLAYSTVYFSGSIYGILSDIVVLFSYLFIAIICHVLALKLETKVVAALGIIGIATMPILSNSIQIEPLYYLLSLAFVTISTLILSYRNLGPWLAKLTLAFVIVAIEWIIAVDGVALSAWTVDLFYCLFFAFVVLSLYHQKGQQKNILLFLAALVGATILLFFQAHNLFSGQMSASFGFNALVAGAVAVIFYKAKHQLTHFLVLLASLWAVLAIVSAVSSAYWGIAWAVEGLLLLYIARKYLIKSVIHQGQALTAIALVYSFSALLIYFPLPALRSADGWILSIVIVAVIGLWQRMINHSEIFDQLTINKIKPFLQFLESLWLSTLLMASAYIWLGYWTGIVVILLQLALLFRAKYCKQVSIEILAAILIIIPLFYVYKGSVMADSYRFMSLPLFAKLALSSAFAQLWLWSAFYRKYQPDSIIKNIAEAVRIVFYMIIPVFWLGSVIRHFDENALMIIWLSPALALFLAQKIRHQMLIKEAKLLTVLASLSLIIVVGEMTLVTGIVALVGFALFYAVAYILEKKSVRTNTYTFICSWALISAGFALPSFIAFQSDNLFLGILAFSLYWSTAFNGMSNSKHLIRNEVLISITNVFILLGAWTMTFFNASYALMPSIFLLSALYQKQNKFNHYKLGRLLGSHSDLLLHTVAAITYTVLLAAMTQYRLDLLMAPMLAVHGALILFMKDKRLTTVKYSFVLILLGIIKLALFDAANALLWQKVVLFMGIGVFILLASFWYQKMISKMVEAGK